MGSRVQKIAFLIFALMFVAIMAILNTSILTLGSSANSQLTATVTSDDSSLSIYDQNSVYGSSVINCAKDPTAVGSTIQQVFVVTNASSATTPKGATYDGTNKYDSTVDATNLVNNTAKFDSYLCYNTNNICTGVLFVQQGASFSAADFSFGGGLTASGLS